MEEGGFERLQRECKTKSKTRHLSYDSFGMRKYLRELFPNQAKMVLKSRCNLLDLKSHRPYMYPDMLCRKCKSETETFDHVVNCGFEEKDHIQLDVTKVEEEWLSGAMAYDISRVTLRLDVFTEIETTTLGDKKRKKDSAGCNDEDVHEHGCS